MYGDLSRKIYEVRKKAVSTIIDYMIGNNLKFTYGYTNAEP